MTLDDLAAALQSHPHLVRIIDTETWDEDVPGAWQYDYQTGRHLSWHVSDHPAAVLTLMRHKGRIVAAYGLMGQFAELGPGLYLSDRPGYWIGRHRGKWDFLTRLTRDEASKLVRYLEDEVHRERAEHYIMQDEMDGALRNLQYVRQGRLHPDVLTEVANQPYNIAFWKPKYLERLGITPGTAPMALEVVLRGRFAEIAGSNPDPNLVRWLQRLGVSGMFVRPGWTANGEMVLWNPRAIVGARVVTLEG